MRVEKRDEAVTLRIPIDNGIQPAAEKMGRNRERRQSAHGRLQIGHQQRRGHALSGHVGDADSHGCFVQWQDIEIIAAYQPGRLPRAGNFISRHLRNLARQKLFLDGLGLGDLTLLLLQMKQCLFPCPGLFLGAPARFAALAPQADLLGKDFQQSRVGPRLLHKVAYTELHRFDC